MPFVIHCVTAERKYAILSDAHTIIPSVVQNIRHAVVYCFVSCVCL